MQGGPNKLPKVLLNYYQKKTFQYIKNVFNTTTEIDKVIL